MRIKNFLRQFTEGTFGDMVDSLNSIFNNGITFADNMSGQVIELEMPVGTEIAISHKLGVVPKYRVILRQRGNFILEDGDTKWDDKAIYLKATQPAASLGFNSSQSTIFATGNYLYGTSAPAKCKKTTEVASIGGANILYGVIEAGCLPDLVATGGTQPNGKVSVTILILRG